MKKMEIFIDSLCTGSDSKYWPLLQQLDDAAVSYTADALCTTNEAVLWTEKKRSEARFVVVILEPWFLDKPMRLLSLGLLTGSTPERAVICYPADIALEDTSVKHGLDSLFESLNHAGAHTFRSIDETASFLNRKARG